jgi:hypothetical protein
MQKALLSISKRTREFTPQELPLRVTPEPPRPSAVPERRPADRIKEALRRWLEEEL